MEPAETYAAPERLKSFLMLILLTAEFVKAVVRNGAGSMMPPFRKSDVSDADLETIAAYRARANVPD